MLLTLVVCWDTTGRNPFVTELRRQLGSGNFEVYTVAGGHDWTKMDFLVFRGVANLTCNFQTFHRVGQTTRNKPLEWCRTHFNVVFFR